MNLGLWIHNRSCGSGITFPLIVLSHMLELSLLLILTSMFIRVLAWQLTVKRVFVVLGSRSPIVNDGLVVS